MNSAPAGTTREGLLYGLVAYCWWGLVPIYFKALVPVNPVEILAHRIVWSMVFLALLLSVLGRWSEMRRCLTTLPILRTLLVTTLLIAANWYYYIYSVDTGQVVQSSLGYFITPLVSVGLGMVFFRERLRRLQAIALGLALAGVMVFASAHGGVPWIAVVLASSFGLYGLLRKTLAVDGLVGLSVETLMLLPLASAYLFWQADSLAWGHQGLGFDVLLALGGVVTAVPLMCFAQAARRLPLTTLGFLQYISPSLQFLLAVLVYDEDFELVKGIGFACIWTALAVFSTDAVRTYRSREEPS